jgi:hypothetical protein
MEALGVTQSGHILNKDRKHFGVKSEMPILDKPPYNCPSGLASETRLVYAKRNRSKRCVGGLVVKFPFTYISSFI